MNNIGNYVKVFMLLFFMTMGFFLVYGTIWKILELPLNDRAVTALAVLAITSEAAYVWWLRRG